MNGIEPPAENVEKPIDIVETGGSLQQPGYNPRGT